MEGRDILQGEDRGMGKELALALALALELAHRKRTDCWKGMQQDPSVFDGEEP